MALRTGLPPNIRSYNTCRPAKALQETSHARWNNRARSRAVAGGGRGHAPPLVGSRVRFGRPTDATHGHDTKPQLGLLLQTLSAQESVPLTATSATSQHPMPRCCARTSPAPCPRCGSSVVGRLAHDPAEECEGVAASDFLDVRVGVTPLDQTTDDVLAIRG